MENQAVADVLVSVLAGLYDQILVLDREAIGGQVVHEGNCSELKNYDMWCKEVFVHCYEGDDVTLFLQKISSETIVKALRTEDEYIVEFSVREDEIEYRKSLKAFESKEGNICVCINDITRQYAKEQSRDRIAGESIELAQQAILGTDRLWQNMNEDIYVPVTKVADLLKLSMEADTEGMRSYVQEAITLLETYANAMEEYFAVSAMEKGEELAKEDVIFTADFVMDVKEMAALQTGKKAELILGKSGKKTAGFIGDRLRLLQVLGNALTGMISGSADKAAQATLDFEMMEEATDLLFELSARGEEESFVQNKYIMFVNRLIGYLNGRVRFGADGETVTLSVRIPVQSAQREQLRKAKVQAMAMENVGDGEFAGYRALVADDDEISREIVVSKLKQYGLDVDTVSDGERAMEKLLSSPGRYYQILFSKMSLPKKSGLDMTMELRELTRRDLNDITIVAVTSNPLRDKRLTALEHGMDHHMVLPFNDIELKEMLLRELKDIGPEEAHEKFGFRIIK